MDRRLMQATFDVDEHHWWYRGRRRIVSRELDRLPIPPDATVLDAGCGSGRTLLDLARYGQTAGVELDPDALALAQTRGMFDVRHGRLEELPWPDDSFNLITCLDVVEHTPDDVASLTEIRRVAKPRAWLLVTVPAYQWLWSGHDVANHHFRRYSRRMLVGALTAAGWDTARVTSFNSVLLAPAVAVRLLERRRPASAEGRSAGLKVGSRAINGALELPLRAEARWLGANSRLPFGLSLMAIAQNPTVITPSDTAARRADVA